MHFHGVETHNINVNSIKTVLWRPCYLIRNCQLGTSFLEYVHINLSNYFKSSSMVQLSSWDVIQYKNVLYKDMNRLLAYEKALNTWARWVKSRVDASKTKISFSRSCNVSGNCGGKKEPIKDPGQAHPAETVLERVLNGLSKPVCLLNTTSLSKLRADAHPSIYGFGGSRGMDCSHWCLPGVPDTWNQLLYAVLN
ncbi:unnamed protein product [Coffea canephora]|uniref:Trichome birefringence-like C-terminal domain-containing protein n=1 Tax=Coffea canephora TaxID=49390 RepID=A0A068VDE8_COFCA|nr:unnamed protein product [Coffea canephora]